MAKAKGFGKKEKDKGGEEQGTKRRFDLTNHPQHTRDVIKTVDVNKNDSSIKDEITNKKEKTIKKSFIIRDSYVEKILDATYTAQYKDGKPWVSQQTIIEEAIDLYFKHNEIVERPEEFVKFQEAKNSKRKAGIKKKKR